MVKKIVIAMAKGALAAGRKEATAELKAAYERLKAKIIEKLGGTTDITASIDMVEKNPESENRRAVLEEDLETGKAGENPEIITEADRLLELLKHAGEISGDTYHAVASGGSTVVQGKNNVVAGKGGIAAGRDMNISGGARTSVREDKNK